MSAYQVKESVVSASARIVKRGDTYVVIESSVVFPEGIWEHIKSYIPKPKCLHQQGCEILTLFIWLMSNCSSIKKKDVALMLRGLLEKETGDEEVLRIGNPEDSLFKRTSKMDMIMRIRGQIKFELNHSLCVWKDEKWKPVRITKISPEKMAVAKSLVDMMKTIINKQPKLVAEYKVIVARRNKITP